MSSKYQQNAKQSRKWFAPFALGIILGVVLTAVVSQFRSEMEEEATVANAALEGARPLDQDTPTRESEQIAAPQSQPQAQSAPQPTAAEPEQQPQAQPAAEPERAAPTAAPAPAAPPNTMAPNAPPGTAHAAQPAAAPPSVKAPAPPMYAAAEKATAPAPTAIIAANNQAHLQLPAASSIVHAPPPMAAVQPAAAAQPPAGAPAAPVDPNSEDAKLAAAAQVRVKGDTPIDSMLDQAFTTEKKAPTPAPAAAPTLAQTPSREDVVNTMSVLVPAIRGCAQGQSGLAPISIVVLSDGHVESAALGSGPFQGTASGRCMEGVVRRARFPHFKQANFRVQFPFAVQ